MFFTYDTRCFLPVHVYYVESGKPVAVLLRPGKTPSGLEVRTLIRHLVRRIRRHWSRSRIVLRGDSHYGRAEAMIWCEENGIDYNFGIAGNGVTPTSKISDPDAPKAPNGRSCAPEINRQKPRLAKKSG